MANTCETEKYIKNLQRFLGYFSLGGKHGIY